MRALRFVLPTAAATLAFVLIAASETRAFDVLGFALGQSLRDVRVHDNFSDASANDNTTPDPDWPGFTGAALAIWKGCAEWCSEKHDLSGDGDPHQPGDVGSGGANFDITWQGLAPSIGGLGERVHSEITGSNPGVYAYTEGPLGGPGSTGWRTRYYSGWTWDDGPSASLPGNRVDLQGIAAHEYGHALGLAHSSVPTATMFAFVPGDGVSVRSLDPDDSAGVQSIYGALDSAVKPHLASATLNGTQLTLTGTNFAATNNEIWFTQVSPAATGTPVIVAGLASNGTVLSATVPPGVGAGDVLVKKGGAGGHKGLSNALAFDPQDCAHIASYCTSGLSTHLCAPAMSAIGIPSASATSGFTLNCTGLEGLKSALIFYGTSGRLALPWGVGGSSYLCVKSPTQRTPPASSGGNAGSCNGSLSLDWLAYLAANPGALGHPLQTGTVVDTQCWYRDPPAPKSTNLSNALEFTTCP